MSVKHCNQFFASIIALSVGLVLISTEDNDSNNGDRKDRVENVIGIDLGTSYSSVGVIKNGKVEILANEQGNKITPSYVAFTPEGQRLIGDAAKEQLISNLENTIFNFKRLIGRHWNDSTVQSDINLFDFNVVKKKGMPQIRVETMSGSKILTVHEVSAMILIKLKKLAEAYLGEKVSKAVITVPAYFIYPQREATVDAGIIAGFDEVRLINEPSAAAITYGLDNNITTMMNILVFKLGAGSLDVSVLTSSGGILEVVATNGNTHLGGEDFDQRVVDYFIQYYEELTGNDLKSDKRAVQRLRQEVERAKSVLSDESEALIEIKSFFDGQDFSEILTREEFEELNEELFRSTIKIVQKVLVDANLNKIEIDEILLVGGSTRIHRIQELLKEFFDGKQPVFGNEHSAAFGATVLAGVLFGKLDKGQILLDVNPFSLGVEVTDRQMNVMIPKNTIIPVQRSNDFVTSKDNLTQMSLFIYEGDKQLTDDNLYLGHFVWTGFQPGPKGHVKVNLTFKLDNNGFIEISGVNKMTGYKSDNFQFSSDYRLTSEEFEQAIENSEIFADDDKKFQKKVQTRSAFKSYVDSIKDQISNLNSCGVKISAKDLSTIESAVNEAIQWLQSDTGAVVRLINAKKKALENRVGPIITKLNARCSQSKNDVDQPSQSNNDEL